jgi:hypothetical protein
LFVWILLLGLSLRGGLDSASNCGSRITLVSFVAKLAHVHRN